MRERSWKEGDNEYMKIFFSSSARVINVTLKMESASQFQESNVQDAKCGAKIKSVVETVLRLKKLHLGMQQVCILVYRY